MERSKSSIILAGLATVGWLGVAAPVGAEEFWIDAPVVDVQPLVRSVQVTAPQEVCWEEPVRHVGYQGRESHTPKILGGIVGGVVGNKFGGGRGQDIMTVAGALLGASIGNDVARRRRTGHPGYTSIERRCEIEYVTREEERADGYRVTYEYNGHEFTTRSPTDPGGTIRVRVYVEPVTYNDRFQPGHQAYRAPGYRKRHKT